MRDDGDLEQQLDAIKRAGLYRTLRRVSGAQETEILLDGRRVINFSGNNTLGLANHPVLKEALKSAVDRYGVGAGASRLISGTMEPHVRFENRLARFLGCERTLLFTSGYQANLGAMTVLSGCGARMLPSPSDRHGPGEFRLPAGRERPASENVIFSDELNHASLIDGIRLSRARCQVYPHNDVTALEGLLKNVSPRARVLVATESLFSMEGDRAPIAEIAALKRIRPFLFYVDEAHAFGAAGPKGRGLSAEAGCWPPSRQGDERGHAAPTVDVLLGTLGKAVGVSGAFVAGSAEVVELLINRARSFIYTTAPMPAMAAALEVAVDLVEQAEELRARLERNVTLFRELVTRELESCELESCVSDAPPAGRDHIVPLLCPGSSRVMRACAMLLERGIYCLGIRPPTVPAGRCRLRFSISALHQKEQLRKAAGVIKEVLVKSHQIEQD